MLKGAIGDEYGGSGYDFCYAAVLLLAMYERNGQPLEKVVKTMITVMFVRPKQRPYKTKITMPAL